MKDHSRIPWLLTIASLVIAGVFSWYGIRRGDRPMETEFSGELPAPLSRAVDPQADQLASISVASITLPHFEPSMPPGEHREVFMANCVSCHSARLVTNQPFFPRAQWEATVQKMVDVFGAPIAENDKAKAVDYLVSIRGAEKHVQH